eukprot:1184330-Prorocentrum_minimum.AAC.3
MAQRYSAKTVAKFSARVAHIPHVDCCKTRTGGAGCSNEGEVHVEADEGAGRQTPDASSPGFSRQMQKDGQLSVCTPPLVAIFAEWS